MPANSTTQPKTASTAGPDGRGKRRPGVDEQREIIRRAAVSLFAESGTRSVSIGDICKKADVSRPTFYRCYEDKDALVASIYEDAVSAPTEGILLRGKLNEPEKLRKNLETALNAIFENAELAQLVFVEANDPTSPAASIVDEAFERSANILHRDLKKAGRQPPSKVYLKATMAAVQWIVYDAIKKGLTPRVKREATSAAFELVIKAL